jgi:glycosyltransferase involved in cell wall biosynthesis
MKVAFDGTVLHGRKSGVGYYSEELLKAMLAANHEDEFFVFSHRLLNASLPSSNGNLKFSNSAHFPVRAVYLHLLLPGVLDAAAPDICHYTNFLAPVSEHRPYVVTIHDMGLEVLRDAHPLAKRLYTRRLIPRVAHKAKLIITNSEYSKWEIVRHLGIPEDRIRVTPLAASPEFAPVKARPANPYFLYVGNLEPRKNLERLIEAFARMPHKEHQLLVVGNRWYQGGAAQQKARSLGLNGRVRFLGYVPREDLPVLFGGATALVYPSLLEGFGLPVVEAMACGTPVITSNNSSLREVAGDAAVLIDPCEVREMTEAMVRVAEDYGLRTELSRKGLKRASEFSWKRTAELTMEAYREVVAQKVCVSDPLPPVPRAALPLCKGEKQSERQGVTYKDLDIRAAILKTIEYANLFQYPLKPDELRERLFDIQVDEQTFHQFLASLHLDPQTDLLKLRADREKISDAAIRDAQGHLATLASIPFVRMIAFSGSTAHRNMTSIEDLDLFIIVEDGKLWAVFLCAMLWAKAKGLRQRLCMNYLISDAALPLLETDAFTAQQAASLKPVFGKSTYDRFIGANPFIRRWFPNFESRRHRDMYREIEAGPGKKLFEGVLRLGPAQILERLSRVALSSYFSRKRTPDSELQLDERRLKLHLHSHKPGILEKF